MPVFLLDSSPDAEGWFVIPKKDLNHLTRVLRYRSGDLFDVLLPTGERGRARLTQKGASWLAQIEEKSSPSEATVLPVWLGVGMIRWPRMEWMLEKATELGLARWTPLALGRGRHKQSNKDSLKFNRLINISKESLKQCERPRAPRMDQPLSLKEFLKLVAEGPPERETLKEVKVGRIFFQERLAQPTFTLDQLPTPLPDQWVLVIGPEGGFCPEEAGELSQNGFAPYSLGDSVYRTETAALYALSVLDFLHRSGRKK